MDVLDFDAYFNRVSVHVKPKMMKKDIFSNNLVIPHTEGAEGGSPIPPSRQKIDESHHTATKYRQIPPAHQISRPIPPSYL